MDLDNILMQDHHVYRNNINEERTLLTTVVVFGIVACIVLTTDCCRVLKKRYRKGRGDIEKNNLNDEDPPPYSEPQ